jgi:hypothetical protein
MARIILGCRQGDCRLKSVIVDRKTQTWISPGLWSGCPRLPRIEHTGINPDSAVEAEMMEIPHIM